MAIGRMRAGSSVLDQKKKTRSRHRPPARAACFGPSVALLRIIRMAGLCDRLDRSRHARPSRSVTTSCVERDVYHADASRQRSQVDRACVDRSLTTRSRGNFIDGDRRRSARGSRESLGRSDLTVKMISSYSDSQLAYRQADSRVTVTKVQFHEDKTTSRRVRGERLS